ncbi:MAG: polymer-forming cytoskeletal protein [candidate division Zixibacteria bacterium]|nr:polymer-forming cytoskeletal protein [candidate division Zixibacteria bacterium]
MIASSKFIYTAFLLIVFLLALAPGSIAQTDPADQTYAPSDTIFNEILLTEEGVIAVDTAGYEWYYDFEYSSFVAGFQPLSDDAGLDFVLGSEYGNIPIEERAIIRKRLRPFESGSVIVREDEYVAGNIISFGKVTVKGWVKGSITSAGRVLITESGFVEGDIQAPRVIEKDGSVVLGEITETTMPLDIETFTPGFGHKFLLVMSIITAVFLFFGFLIFTLMPGQVATMQSCILKHKGRSAGLGFILILTMPVIATLLGITIVGAVLIPFLPLLYLAAIILGLMTFGRLLFSKIYKQTIYNKSAGLFIGVIGILIVMIPWLITGALWPSSDNIAGVLSVFGLVFSILGSIYPVFSGVGAAFLTRFGFREYPAGPKKPQFRTKPAAHQPAPPPIPDTPVPENIETPKDSSRISDQDKNSQS